MTAAISARVNWRSAIKMIGFWQALGWMTLPFAALPALVLFFPKFKFINSLSKQVIIFTDTINTSLGEIIKWALPTLIVAIVASIIALSIFGLSFTKLDELPVYLHAAVIMLGCAATLLASQHVRVDIFYGRLPARGKAFVGIIAFYIFSLPVCVLLIWVSQGFVAGSWRGFEGSNEATGIRGIFLLKTLIPVFAVTMLAQTGSVAARAAMIMRGQTPPPRPRNIEDLFGQPLGDSLKDDL